MMKQYHLYVFTRESCPPCQRLKDHIETLSELDRADLVPLKTPTGNRTALAEELTWNLHRRWLLFTRRYRVTTMR